MQFQECAPTSDTVGTNILSARDFTFWGVDEMSAWFPRLNCVSRYLGDVGSSVDYKADFVGLSSRETRYSMRMIPLSPDRNSSRLAGIPLTNSMQLSGLQIRW